jgi:lambda family phage portal protein
VSSPNPLTLAGDTRTLSQRARWAARNDARAAAAVEAIVSNVIGSGIKPQPTAENARWKRTASEAFEEWADLADFHGRLDFYGLQALIARTVVEAGECFVRFRPRPIGEGPAVPMQLEVIDPDLCPTDLNRELGGDARISAGVEFASDGRRVAYHFHKRRPGAGWTGTLETVRVPAGEVLHVFRPLVADQIRGVSWLTPVLLRLSALDKFDDSSLIRAKVASLFSVFVETPEADGESNPLGDDVDDDGNLHMGPGSVVNLGAGETIKVADPPDFGDSYADFTTAQLRAIAAGLGLPYEVLSGDLSKVNFSSLRAALVEFRRRVTGWQFHTFVNDLCAPVWRRWVEYGVASGALPTPAGFRRRPALYTRCKWLPEGWSWLDPQKDAAAKVAMLGAGLISRDELISELGEDAEKVDQEIAAAQARADRLGLKFSFDARAPETESEREGEE